MLTAAMTSKKLPCQMFVPTSNWQSKPMPFRVVPALESTSRLARGIAWKFGQRMLFNQLERLLMKELEACDDRVVWTFGELPIELSRNLNVRGVRVIREKFNCAKATARDILTFEHQKNGFPAFTDITDAMIDKEAEELALADAIFCPSPEVSKSMVNINVSSDKLLKTSYGWDPARFQVTTCALSHTVGPTLLFVGTLTVRKGIHFLLEAWEKANIKGGRLILAGQIDPIIRERYGHVLARDDVEYVGLVNDVGSLYRSADLFVFASLEEGGPQVTYEAAACGIPALVTPMGAGAFTRDGYDGIVLASNDADDWSQLISSLPDRRADQHAMAASAQERAKLFTWAQVGAQRRNLLFGSLGQGLLI